MEEEAIRRAINFDLYAQGLKELKLDSATTYKTIRKWFADQGFEHDQLSSYISKKPMTDKEVSVLLSEFMITYPKIIACVEGSIVTDVVKREQVTNLFTEFIHENYPQYDDIHTRALQMRIDRNGHTTLTQDDISIHDDTNEAKREEKNTTPRVKTKADAQAMLKKHLEKRAERKNRKDKPSHGSPSHWM